MGTVRMGTLQMGIKWRAFLIVGSLALLADQAAKWGVREHLAVELPVQVLGSFFGLLRVEGEPDVFGVFGQVPMAVLAGIASLGMGLLGALLLRSEPSDRLAGTALGFILGGALGNLVDRFHFEQVVDFLRFDLGLFVFPLFNLADAWIALGAGLLLLDIVASEASEAVLREENES